MLLTLDGNIMIRTSTDKRKSVVSTDRVVS